MARDQLNILLRPEERAELDAIVESERARAGDLGVPATTITAGSVIRMWIRDHHKKLIAKPAPNGKRKR